MRLLLLVAPLIFIVFASASAEAATLNCTNCSDCSGKIASASSGDIVRLNSSIPDYQNGTCIFFSGKANLTFDCLGNVIDGNDTGGTYGIWLNDSSTSAVRNCTVTDFGYGILMINSSNGTIADVIVKSDSYGMLINSSFNNSVMNLTALDNMAEGLELGSAQYNTINNSRIWNNTNSGICMVNSTYNAFYNNYFNNSNNTGVFGNGFNSWNATLNCSLGPNIIGGPCIGGNYYTDSDGNFSDTCADANGDGICDSSYDQAADNVDYYPLSEKPPQLIFVSPSSNGSVTSNSWILVNVTANETLPWCVLNWYNGSWTNVSMTAAGMYCYVNMTSLSSGSYYFRVWANDSFGNVNGTGDRQVNVDATYPLINITNPVNGTNYSSISLELNFTYTESNLHTCWYHYNGTNTTLGNCTSTNFTALDHQLSELMVWINDTAGNLNSSAVFFSACTESWSCSGWSACSWGVQTRTCTDAYSCGTVISRPGLTESCTSGSSGGGGGGSPAIEPPQVEKTWDRIEPGGQVSLSIDKSGLGFSEIRITVSTQVNNISIKVTRLEGKPAEVSREVSGKVYQYVSVNATNLNPTSLKSAEIRFKVSKSWISQNSIDRNRVYLNHYSISGWSRLNTTYDGDDSQNLYYLAESPGFSYFVITGEMRASSIPVQNQTQAACNNNGICDPGENETACPADCKPQKQCEPGMFMCHGSVLDGCQDGIWVAYTECKNGCLNARCMEAAPEPVRIPAVIIIIVAGAIAIIVELILWRKKFSPWRYFRI